MSLTPKTERRGIRTDVLLIAAMVVVMVITMTLLVLLVRERFRMQATEDLQEAVQRSLVTFGNLQQDRFDALERENSLLASLPTLKALMTSGDDLTIEDGAVEYWQLGGNDLMALTNPEGRVISLNTRVSADLPALGAALTSLIAAPAQRNVVDGNTLYACSVRPIYFGATDTGTLLGYIVSGISIERTVRQISASAGAEAAFLNGGHIVASTLDAYSQSSLIRQANSISPGNGKAAGLKLGKERYEVAAEALPTVSVSPLQLVVLKSVAPTEDWIARTDRVVLSAGLIALLVGAIGMVILARVLTAPLQDLSRSLQAFGAGDTQHAIPRSGTREVRELSDVFSGMRGELQRANQARLASERLATIGLMASSVSHDLRHYLSAVYANAEFLASDNLGSEERGEIFADIRSAVLGTADMIESLLIFGRTGSSVRFADERIVPILENSLTLVRAHSDARNATFTTCFIGAQDAMATVDAKQLERAVYNLLLNACQAGLAADRTPHVDLTLTIDADTYTVRIVDNGNGIPESIRARLFEPFVSEGKQKGTGLGLTLAHCIAAEHGGEVRLVSSAVGETIFELHMLLHPAPIEPGAPTSGKTHEALVH